MNGTEFYNLLQDTFKDSGETIFEDYTFQGWVPTEDGSAALKFELGEETKLIPKDILIAAWETSSYTNNDMKYNTEYPNDVRLQLLHHLVEICSPLRKVSA